MPSTRRSHSSSSLFWHYALLLAMILDPAAGVAQEAGQYGSVELLKREQPLIKTAGELEGRFIERSLRLSDPELEAWLGKIGERLEPATEDPWVDYRFFLLREPTANAFALPDGQIYVHSGLLAVLENEAQLAGVLAHEIQHVAGHHGILAHRNQRSKSLISTVIGSLSGIGAFGDFGDLITGATNQYLVLSLLGYSRRLEEEADHRGIRRLAEGGYDVLEMARAYEILNRDPEGERPVIATKWSTHPDLLSRASDLSAMAIVLSGRSTGERVGRDEFRLRTRPVALLTIRDQIARDHARSAVDLARRLVAAWPEDAAALVALGDALHALGPRSERAEAGELVSQTEKRRQWQRRQRFTREERYRTLIATESGRENLETNLRAAEAAYLEALASDPESAEPHLGLGRVYRDLERPADAARALRKYLTMSPGSPDEALVMEELRELRDELLRANGGS